MVKTTFWANKDIRRQKIAISVVLADGRGVEAFARPLIFDTVPDGDDMFYQVPVCMELSYEDASQLMTELWDSGVRPQAVGTTGELQAVKYHLEDMRKLVFSENR